MLRFYVAAAIATWLGSAAVAQESPTLDIHRVSVEDAVAIALERAESIDSAIARRDRAEAEETIARAPFWPQIAGSTSYQRTFASQFDAISDGTGAPNPFAEIDLPFGQPNTWQLGLTASQEVWSGGAVRARTRLAEAALGNAELAVAQARAEVALDAAGAFYDALLADQLVGIAAASQDAAERTLEVTRVGFEVGVRPEFDVLRSEVEVENQRVTRIRAVRQRDVAFLRLRQILDLPEGAVLDLEVTNVDAVPVATDLAGVETTDTRVPVLQAEGAIQIARASVKVARAQMLPALALGVTASTFAYPEGVLPPVGKEGTWHEDVSASLALQVPLFTGGRARGFVSAARADLAESMAQLELVQELADLDRQDAEAAIAAARAQWEATGSASAQASRAYEIAEVRFREGMSTQVELTDTLLALRQAQANRAIAARDFELSRLRLALLPALPLGISSGVAPATVTSGTSGISAISDPGGTLAPTAPTAPAAPASGATGGTTAAPASF